MLRVCTQQLEYRVILEDSDGGLFLEKEFTSAICTARVCNTTFPITNPHEDYSVNITSYNGLGEATSWTLYGN